MSLLFSQKSLCFLLGARVLLREAIDDKATMVSALLLGVMVEGTTSIRALQIEILGTLVEFSKAGRVLSGIVTIRRARAVFVLLVRAVTDWETDLKVPLVVTVTRCEVTVWVLTVTQVLAIGATMGQATIACALLLGVET